MSKQNRQITPETMENAQRLRVLWERKKLELGLNQSDVAKQMGWSGSSTFSQYMQGRLPIGFEACLRLAKILHVHPADIIPDIAEFIPSGIEPENDPAIFKAKKALKIAESLIGLPENELEIVYKLARLNDRVGDS